MAMPSWLAPFFTLSYWFTPYPAPFTGVYFWLIIGAAAGSFLAGLILGFIYTRFKDPSTRRIARRLGNLGLTFGLLLAVSFFFTQTSTPTLGSRFWFLGWLILAIVWFGFILKYAFVQAPRERANRSQQLVNKKYFNN